MGIGRFTPVILGGLFFLMMALPRLFAQDVTSSGEQEGFSPGEKVLIGVSGGTDGIKVVGTVRRELGSGDYEVALPDKLGKAQISAQALHELNDPTRPSPGLLKGLRNIKFVKDDPRFVEYVERIRKIVDSHKIDFSLSPDEVAAAQGALIDRIMEEQRTVVVSTRGVNQKIRFQFDVRPERTLGDILAGKEWNGKPLADTFDASTLLWAVLYESGAVEKAGLKVQIVRGVTPAYFEEVSLIVKYANGVREIVDPIWVPMREPIEDGVWPQQSDVDRMDASKGSRRILEIHGDSIVPAASAGGDLGKVLDVGTIAVSNAPVPKEVKVEGVSAGEQVARGPSVDKAVVEQIRAAMYSDSHPLRDIWTGQHLAITGIESVPGRVVWVNPLVSFPQLGIKAGVPPTREQLDALARLFGVRIVHGREGDGWAVFPTHVGRAVNPNPFAVTVVGPKGEEIPDMVLKGVGATDPNKPQGFNFPLRDAFRDADLSMQLMEKGVRVYRPLLIFVPDESPDKAVYVRAPDSMLRQKDFALLTDEELKPTLEMVLKNDARMKGRAKPMDLWEWTDTFLPYESGRNAGMLAGLGVTHLQLRGNDNHGLFAETVDWDRFLLGSVDLTGSQKSLFWNPVADVQKRLYSLDASRQIRSTFEKGFSDGFATTIRSGGIALHEGTLEMLDTKDIGNLYREGVAGAQDRTTLLGKLRERGLLKPGAMPGTVAQEEKASGAAVFVNIPVSPVLLDQALVRAAQWVRMTTGRLVRDWQGVFGSRGRSTGTSVLEVLEKAEKKMTTEKVATRRASKK